MSNKGVSEEMEQFVATNIHSLHQLETLLLLQREASRAWTAAQVAAELRTNPSSAATTLDELARNGLLVSDGGADPAYVYSPATPEMDARVVELGVLYQERRLTVIDLIFSRPERLGAIRAFADAFRIRKKGP